MIMRVFILFLIFVKPAYALSCLPPDAVRLLQFAQESPDPYVLVKGRISGPVNLPEAGTREPARSTVRVEGKGLNRNGFSASIAREITLELTCLSVWCATPPEGEQIMALKVEGDARTLEIGPCGGNAVAWTEDGESRLLECYQNGNCQLPDF